MTDKNLLSIRNLSKYYRPLRSFWHSDRYGIEAVSNLSFDVNRGECLGLIGQTGSGKTTLGRCLLRLVPADFGQLFYDGIDLFALSEKEFRKYRPKFQMIFQNPGQALNPMHTVATIISEPLRLHKNSAQPTISELMEMVSLDISLLDRFPHQLSGGQKQRVAIARALAAHPLLVIADEPTSSLDASLKNQMIELLLSLQKKMNMTVIVISHDFSVISHTASRVGVMYNGRLIEIGPIHSLVHNPLHPYTRHLLLDDEQHPTEHRNNNLFRRNDKRGQKRKCPYAEECSVVFDMCKHAEPMLKTHSGQWQVACHKYSKNDS